MLWHNHGFGRGHAHAGRGARRANEVASTRRVAVRCVILFYIVTISDNTCILSKSKTSAEPNGTGTYRRRSYKEHTCIHDPLDG